MANDWPQASRVPSFAQMLKKNLPAQASYSSGQPSAHLSPQAEQAKSMFSPVETSDLSSLAAKVVPITGQVSDCQYSKAAPTVPITSLPPKKIPREFVIKYKQGEINPVSALHQFAQMQRVQLELKETVATGNLLGAYFAFCAVVDGIQYKTGLGQNKKESKSNAAKLALDELLQLEETEPKALENPGRPRIFSETAIVAEPQSTVETSYVSRIPYEGRHLDYENISQIVKETFSSLTVNYPEYQGCSSSLAAFIVKRARQCEVVAIGTGELNYSQCGQPDGRILHDSHAVVTARRSLLRFRFQEEICNLQIDQALFVFGKNLEIISGPLYLRGIDSRTLEDAKIHEFLSPEVGAELWYHNYLEVELGPSEIAPGPQATPLSSLPTQKPSMPLLEVTSDHV